jgi:hypothetical protein
MEMEVEAVGGGVVTCSAITKEGGRFRGGWTFDARTGAEEDADLGWGVKFGATGSYIRPKEG